MEQLRIVLLKHIYTRTRMLHIVGLLQRILEKVLWQEDSSKSVTERYQQALNDEVDNSEDGLVLARLGDEWLTDISRDNLTEEINKLHEWIEALPVVRLYVPVLFDVDGEGILGKWGREFINQSILLQLEVDPNTVGGCGMIVSDQYHEYSLRTKLKDQPQTVRQIFHTYESS